MKINKVLFFFLLLSDLLPASQINNVRFSHLNIMNGLPQNTVNCIAQDNQGFVWLGTRNGLCRYDGYEIRNYFNDVSDSLSLTNNFIISLHTDKNGRLWIFNEKGICQYNKLTDKFKRYNLWKGYNVLRGNFFCETAKGRLYVSIFNEVYVYNQTTDKFDLILSNAFLRENSAADVFSLAVDKNDVLWIGTGNGIHWYDLNNKEFSNRIVNNQLSVKLANLQINRIHIDKFNRIWIGTSENGIIIYLPTTQSIMQFRTKNGLSNNNIGAICQDQENNTWIGTEQGINIVDNNLRLIKKIEQNATDLSNLSDNAIYSIFSDNASNIWIGTFFGGLNIFHKGSDSFSIYPFGYLDKHLSGKAVRQIIANDETSLWIATEDGGLNFLDRRSGNIQHYQNNAGKIKLSYHNIHSLLKDNNKNLWIGTFTGGLNCYNIPTGRMKYYSIAQNNFPAVSIFALLQDSRGTIWAGTPTGLMYYLPDKDQFVRFNNNAVSREFIYCLFQNSHANIWIGTRSRGLLCMDAGSKRIRPVKLFGKFENFITSITEDRKKQIWIGTNNSGVYYVYRNSEPKRLTQKEGLPSNSIKGIVEDNSGKLWFSTESGLCRYDQITGNIENFSINDGLPTNQFNYSSTFKTSDGELFFGTINGLISFYPNSLIPTKKVFKVEVTDFKISGKSVVIGADDSPLKENISETNLIELSHDQASSFSFDFTGLNFKYATNTLYAMRLIGADTDWQIINKQHQILFSNLPEGKYTLQIKASIDGMNWDESGMRSLDIIIRPPFWRSWWAYIIYFFIAALVAQSLFNIMGTRMKLRMEFQAEHDEKLRLEELNQHKINFFTFITHDLKTPLTLILSPLQRLINSNSLPTEVRKKLDVIFRNANRMNHLIDEIMTFSKIEMKQMKITVKQGNVLSFIYEISSIFEMIAMEREIDFVIDIQLNQNEIVWFSSSNLERIIYNLLSNAFKYTPTGGMITLFASLEHVGEQVYLNVHVEDSGRGIPKHLLEKIFDNYYQVERKDANEGAGIGLALTKVLVNIHKGTIRAESDAIGTRFIVRLNVSEAAFEEDEKSDEQINVESLDKNKLNFMDSVKMFSESMPVLSSGKSRKKKILIVEDNSEMNDYLDEIFNPTFDVIRTYNGKDGLEKVISKTPDLIVCDIMMPVMNGLELTSRLKADLSFSHIPIVLLTAKNIENDFTKGYQSGADAYIVKPFNAENLELLVNNLLQTRERNIERFRNDDDTNIKEIVSNPRDEKFMSDLVKLIMDNMENEEFGVTEITTALAVSRSLLHIKLKKLADVSITEFIRQIKMKEARKLLMNGHNVSETSYAVGISDPNYFSKCFKKYSGLTPSEFVKEIKKN